MAGIIDFDKDTYWGSSGDAFRGMVAGVCEFLGNDEVSLRLRGVLTHAVETGLMYVDFGRDFDAPMAVQFIRSLREHLADPKTLNPENGADPEMLPGYLNKLRELFEMAERYGAAGYAPAKEN